MLPYDYEIDKGIEGLVHISELSWTKKYSHPNELLAIGDVIETVVLDIDKNNQKISLGIKQLEADPWIGVEEKFPAGTKVKGKIRNLTDYGAFVELENDLEGLVPVSELEGKTQAELEDKYKAGDKIAVKVIKLIQTH